MPTLRFTDRNIRTLRTEKESEEFFDTEFQGIGVRVFRSGNKQFFVRYTNQSGQRRRVRIGDLSIISLSEARKLAKGILADVTHGHDPVDAKNKARAAETVEQICAEFARLYLPSRKLSTRAEYIRIIKREILPVLGKMKARDVSRRHVIALLEEMQIARAIPVLAERTKAVLSRVFSWALERELIQTNPVAGIRRTAVSKPRSRVLNPDEIKTLLTVLDGLSSQTMANIFRILLYTGQRPGEVTGMRWSEVDGDTWRIPSERTKNSLAHKVYLTTPVVRALENQREINGPGDGSDFVFPSAKTGQNLKWLNHRARSIVQEMGCPEWTPHDLRRTVATHLQDAGISPDVIDRLQNHKLQGVRAHYLHGDQWNAVKHALEKWAQIVSRAIDNRTINKVINLR
jgi:integrase